MDAFQFGWIAFKKKRANCIYCAVLLLLTIITFFYKVLFQQDFVPELLACALALTITTVYYYKKITRLGQNLLDKNTDESGLDR